MKGFYLFIAVLVLFSCRKDVSIQEVSMKEDVYFLADDAREGRETGSEKERQSADYLAERFRNLGLKPKGVNGYLQPFIFKPKTNPHGEATYLVNKEDSTITGLNVIALIDNKSANTIIIGAH